MVKLLFIHQPHQSIISRAENLTKSNKIDQWQSGKSASVTYSFIHWYICKYMYYKDKRLICGAAKANSSCPSF